MEWMIGVLVVLLMMSGVFAFIYYSNHSVVLSKHVYCNAGIPQTFHGYRILQVSDLHGDLPRRKFHRLLGMIREEKPDIVVFTGDAIDHVHRRQYHKAVAFMQELSEEFTVYYVTGNHEYMHVECRPIIGAYERMKCRVLHNEEVSLEKDGQKIYLYGVDDPYALYKGNVPEKYKTPEDDFRELFRSLFPERSGFSILLSHRPEFFDEYVAGNYDLVFTGHAHGGQWWIPFVQGLIAPDQGLFPKYVKGKYVREGTTMYVSRGLGNSVVPVRLFNRPELVMVTLQGE